MCWQGVAQFLHAIVGRKSPDHVQGLDQSFLVIITESIFALASLLFCPLEDL